MAETSVRIFISYAHEDEVLQRKLAEHLRILDGCTVWTDREITGGEAWNREISRELDSADIILLLLSSSFLSSEFVSKTEIPRALKRHEEKSARVVPVLGRPVKWAHLPIAKLQAFPADEKWLEGTSSWKSLDEAAKDVATSIETLIQEIHEDRLRQHTAKQRAEEDYRREVADALSDGPITVLGRQTLEEVRERLGISIEVADLIEAAEIQPIEEHRKKLRKYEESVVAALENWGGLSSSTARNELKKRQSKLGLPDEDAASIEQLVTYRLERERQAEVDRKAAEEAQRKAEEEALRLAQVEAERKVAEEARRKLEEEQRRVEEEARRQAQAEAERKAAEEARRKAEAQRLAEEEAQRKAQAEADRKAVEEARRKAEAQRLAEEEARRQAQAEAERKAAEEARRKAEAQRLAEEEARRKAQAEADRKAVEEARRKAEETERLAEEEAQRKAQAEAERRAVEEARRKAEAQRLAEEEAQRKAQVEAERRAAEEARRKAEAPRLAEEETQRKAQAEAERKAAEEARRKAEAQRLADEEAGRKAQVEAERRAAEESRRKAEAKRLAEEEAQRKAQVEAERKAAEKARRKAEEEQRRAEAEARRQAQVEAERRAAARLSSVSIAPAHSEEHAETTAPSAPHARLAPATPFDKYEDTGTARKRFPVVALVAAVVLVLGGLGVVLKFSRSDRKPPSEPVAESQAAGQAASSTAAGIPKSAPAVQPETPTPATPRSRNSAPPRNSVPVPKASRQVHIETKPPGAHITIADGTPANCTSPCVVTLTDGRHSLLASLEGYRNSPRTLELPRDQNLKIEMSQLLGSLAVTTVPAGATILIDGKPRAERSPALFQLPAGTYKLQVVKGENKSDEEAVVIHDGVISRRTFDIQ